MAVYFLRPIGLAGPVKIGCSKVAESRLKTYTAWSPFPLEIAAKIKGDETIERRFHARFAFLHSHGEWFKGHPDLSHVIGEIVSGHFDVSSLPEPEMLPRRRKPRRKYTEMQSLRIGLAMRFQSWRRSRGLRPDFESPLWLAYCHLSSREPFDINKAIAVYHHLESVAPAPKSKSTTIMRRLLAERSTPTADTAA